MKVTNTRRLVRKTHRFQVKAAFQNKVFLTVQKMSGQYVLLGIRKSSSKSRYTGLITISTTVRQWIRKQTSMTVIMGLGVRLAMMLWSTWKPKAA